MRHHLHAKAAIQVVHKPLFPWPPHDLRRDATCHAVLLHDVIGDLVAALDELVAGHDLVDHSVLQCLLGGNCLAGVALGLGGFSLGRAEDSFGGVDTEIEVRGWEFFGRVIRPVSVTFDLYGRIGAGTYFVDIDPGSVSFQDAILGESFVDVGFGVDFGRKEKLAFRLEGRYLNGGADETGALMYLGFNYLF